MRTPHQLFRRGLRPAVIVHRRKLVQLVNRKVLGNPVHRRRGNQHEPADELAATRRKQKPRRLDIRAPQNLSRRAIVNEPRRVHHYATAAHCRAQRPLARIARVSQIRVPQLHPARQPARQAARPVNCNNLPTRLEKSFRKHAAELAATASHRNNASHQAKHPIRKRQASTRALVSFNARCFKSIRTQITLRRGCRETPSQQAGIGSAAWSKATASRSAATTRLPQISELFS